MKLQHWRGFTGEIGLEAAPVLESDLKVG